MTEQQFLEISRNFHQAKLASHKAWELLSNTLGKDHKLTGDASNGNIEITYAHIEFETDSFGKYGFYYNGDTDKVEIYDLTAI
jgi:hypothetical protein